MLVTFLGVALGRGATPAVGQQAPQPGGAVHVFLSQSTDGMGIVVTWSLAQIALQGDGFILMRHPGGMVGDVPVAQLGNATRGYTDYGVSTGTWCYYVLVLTAGQPVFRSYDVCLYFVSGARGTKAPVLNTGCQRFYQTQPVGTPMAQVAAQFDPPSAVTGIWRYDATQGRLLAGYFVDATAPLDFTTLPATSELQYVCLRVPAVYNA